jgi:hypothetical protein
MIIWSGWGFLVAIIVIINTLLYVASPVIDPKIALPKRVLIITIIATKKPQPDQIIISCML